MILRYTHPASTVPKLELSSIHQVLTQQTNPQWLTSQNAFPSSSTCLSVEAWVVFTVVVFARLDSGPSSSLSSLMKLSRDLFVFVVEKRFRGGDTVQLWYLRSKTCKRWIWGFAGGEFAVRKWMLGVMGIAVCENLWTWRKWVHVLICTHVLMYDTT